MYEGQAKLKLYENAICTREYKCNIVGNYYFETKIITGQPTHNITKRIFIKNVGEAPAYNIQSSTSSVTIEKARLLPEESCYIDINVYVEQGVKDTTIFNFDLEYSNV